MSRVVRVLPPARDLFGAPSPRALLSCKCIAVGSFRRGQEVPCESHVWQARAAANSALKRAAAERSQRAQAQGDNATREGDKP